MAKSDRQQALASLNRIFIVCPDCDALWQRPKTEKQVQVKCSRCGCVLIRPVGHSMQRTVALTLAGLILFIVAVSFPFLEVERSGLSNRISIIDAVHVLWKNNMYLLSVATAFFILLFPLVELVVFFYLGLHRLRQQSMTRKHATALRIAHQLAPWSMAEIFMIGVIVSLVKVGELADIRLDIAFWAMVCLILVLYIASVIETKEDHWQELKEAR